MCLMTTISVQLVRVATLSTIVDIGTLGTAHLFCWFGSAVATVIAQTPLIRFVVDLLWTCCGAAVWRVVGSIAALYVLHAGSFIPSMPFLGKLVESLLTKSLYTANKN